MTYLEILSWARKGIIAERKEIAEMRETAYMKCAEGDPSAGRMIDALSAKIRRLDTDAATLDEIEAIHNRK